MTSVIMKLESCSLRQNPLFYLSVFVNILLSYYILSLKVSRHAHKLHCITKFQSLQWHLRQCFLTCITVTFRLNPTSSRHFSQQDVRHAQTVRVPLIILMANSNLVLIIIWMDSMLNKWKSQKIFLKIHLTVRNFQNFRVGNEIRHIPNSKLSNSSIFPSPLSNLPVILRFRDRHGNIWTGS